MIDVRQELAEVVGDTLAPEAFALYAELLEEGVAAAVGSRVDRTGPTAAGDPECAPVPDQIVLEKDRLARDVFDDLLEMIRSAHLSGLLA